MPSDDQPPPGQPSPAPPAPSLDAPDPAAPPVAAGPKIGVALSAGAARGWAHIGVLQRFEEIGLRPMVVAGCSSGALVGAAYTAGALDRLSLFARSLTWSGMLRFFDISWRGGGLIQGRWLMEFLGQTLGDESIDALRSAGRPRFGAVATELSSGRETWLAKGSMASAVRASIALPGLIAPERVDGRWLVDGALVNPLPVSLCRALGAEIIIGVSMQGDLVTRGAARPLAVTAGAFDAKDTPPAARASWLKWMVGAGAPQPAVSAAPAPVGADAREKLGYLEVLGDSLFIVQNFVSRVRLAADPVDVLIAPDVAEIGMMDFHRGSEAIERGRRAVDAAEPALKRLGLLSADRPAGT